MVKLRSFCGHCCFLNKKTKKCENQLLDKYIDVGANLSYDDDNNPVIDRICQYKRDLDWQPEKDLKDKLIQVRDEVYIKGTIIILAHSSKDLKKTFENIVNQKNSHLFKIIIIYSSISCNEVSNICNSMNKVDCEFMKIFDDENIKYHIYKSLNMAKNGFLFILEADKETDPNLIDKINNMVNQKMFRILHVSENEELHQSVSMIHIYKWLKGDLQCSISKKLEDISNEENVQSQVFTWKEVNEQYSL